MSTENATSSNQSCITVSETAPGVLLMTLDMPGTGANILTQSLFDELDETMEQLSQRTDVDGLILISAKRSIFIAGADLHFITRNLDWPDKQIIRFCERGRAVMARFSRCPFVTVAAIHGAAVGGGLELPLWCDCRIATDHPRTILGLPEVNLGLVPGWAGTVRLPRIANLEVALDLVTSGRNVSAQQALAMGFVDEICQPEELVQKAAEMIRRVNTSESFVLDRKRIMGPVDDLTNLQEKNERYGKQIVANEDVFPYAPMVVLEHMLRSAILPQREAWKSESLAMAQVWGSPASRGLLNHFFLVDHNKKQPGLVDQSLSPRPVQRLGIVGAGLMGQSIAAHCLKQGISITILDANPARAIDVAERLNQDMEEPGILAVNEFGAFAQCDMVIESVVETIDVKKSVLAKMESAVRPDTLIASNTSSIPIGHLAKFLDRPQRFCGIHFCHPELMSMVEVVCGPDTSEQTIADAVGLVRALRKMPVAMNDGAGFVVNRILAAMLDQSLRMVSGGLSVERIDHAIREFGFRGGPFEIIDVIGTDTCMYAGRTMWEAGLKCVSVSPVLPKLVKLGRLGRKSGTGFYRYDQLRGPRRTDPELSSLIQPYVTSQRLESISNEDIATQILSVMVLEATRILEEDLVADFRDVELCVIHGFTFPKHRGGILFWADEVGLEQVNRTLYQLAEQEPRLEPSDLLKSMRFQKRKFYTSS